MEALFRQVGVEMPQAAATNMTHKATKCHHYLIRLDVQYITLSGRKGLLKVYYSQQKTVYLESVNCG